MKQTKFMSLVESVLNIAIGFGISLAAQWFFLPLLGVQISFSQNLQFAFIMTAISIARSYLLRRLFEALHIRVPLSPAMQAVIAERLRQVQVEGWDSAHDDSEHLVGDLALAASCYARTASWRRDRVCEPELSRKHAPAFWPWESHWWKPQDDRRDLVRAGALIVAEIERGDRKRRRK